MLRCTLSCWLASSCVCMWLLCCPYQFLCVCVCGVRVSAPPFH